MLCLIFLNMHEKAKKTKKKNEKSNCTKEWIYGMVTKWYKD